jgi:hypothetical protein
MAVRKGWVFAATCCVVLIVMVPVAASLWSQHVQKAEEAKNQTPLQEEKAIATLPSGQNNKLPDNVAPPSSDTPPLQEQQWLQANLPSQDLYRGGGDQLEGSIADVIADHIAFDVKALDNEKWEVVTRESETVHYFPGTTKARVGTHQEKTTCDLSYRNVPWVDSWIDVGYVYSLQPDYGNELSKKYELVVNGNKDILNCATSTQFGDQPVQMSADISEFRLTFYSREAASSARMAIIRHANPDVAKAIDAEREWINSHLEIGSVKRSGVMSSPNGQIHLGETSSTNITPLSVDWLLFDSRITTHRKQGNDENDLRAERACDVWPKKIDWSTAQIAKYQAPIGVTDSSAYSLSVTAPKGILCEEDWPDMKPPSHSRDGHLLFLLFPTEASAQQFAENMRLHTNS